MIQRKVYFVLSVLVMICFSSAAPLFSNGDKTCRIQGSVLSSFGPVQNSKTSLFSIPSSSNETPKVLDFNYTNNDGSFSLESHALCATNSSYYSFYIVSEGGEFEKKIKSNGVFLTALTINNKNNAISLGQSLIINELTTVASATVLSQFITVVGDTSSPSKDILIAGPSLSIKNAIASMYTSLVNPNDGTVKGTTIASYENGRQTPNLGRFQGLANLIAGCTGDILGDKSCLMLFELSKTASKNTFSSIHSIVANPWRNIKSIYMLLRETLNRKVANYVFEQVDSTHKKTTTIDLWKPYLPSTHSNVPLSWSIGVKHSGGGLSAPGGLALTADGDLWAGNNFYFGSGSSLEYNTPSYGASKYSAAKGGIPVSPEVTGFVGGGIMGAGFGIAIQPDDSSVWIGNWGGKSISRLSADGSPVSPFSGYSMNRTMGHIQGLAVDSKGNLWAADYSNSNVIVRTVKGEWVRVCTDSSSNTTSDYTESLDVSKNCEVYNPFMIATDDITGTVWVTNSGGGSVTKFSSTNSSKPAEIYQTGSSPKGVAIDSQGNAWVANFESGTVTLIYADNSKAPSTFGEGVLQGPWGINVDGDDNVWIADFQDAAVYKMCGVKTENCQNHQENVNETVSATGSLLSGGFKVPGIQHVTDVRIDETGNVWAANNWQKVEICIKKIPANELDSTLCNGDGVVVLYGAAKPVKTPLVGRPKSL